MPSCIRPKRSPGVKQRMRLPQGQVTSTYSLPSLKAKRVPSSGFFTACSLRTRASRFGITRPVWPRTTCCLPVGRWNWLRPTFIHMLPTPVIR